MTYGDYYKVRYGLTYGALEDARTGRKMLADVDPEVADLVRRLGVADAGELQSNGLVAVG